MQETWEDLERWADDIAKIYTVKLLRDSNYSDEKIREELNLTEEALNRIVKKID